MITIKNMKVGINGFGRIGRLLFRAALETNTEIDFAVVNDVTETKILAKKWKYRVGWHRVVFYGDWRKELKELSALLNLKFVEEDKEACDV